MPVFLKGLSGYRSIVHLNKVVASSNAAPTQPKQTEQGSAPPRLLPSSRTGRAAAWGCRRPRGLLTLTSVKAGSGLPALQVTSGLESARTRTPIPPPPLPPPCSGAAPAAIGHTPALPAAPRSSARSTALWWFSFFLASYPDASLTQPRLRDAGTRLKTTEGGRRTRVRAERQRAERAAAVPRCARPGGIRRR